MAQLSHRGPIFEPKRNHGQQAAGLIAGGQGVAPLSQSAGRPEPPRVQLPEAVETGLSIAGRKGPKQTEVAPAAAAGV